MKLATFTKGGVHPSDMKSLSNRQPIERLPIPGELVISMSQHLGAPATPVKAVGDRVSKGEKIGTASSFISADVHSPVDGTVTAIRKVTMANSVSCRLPNSQKLMKQCLPFPSGSESAGVLQMLS